jgi:hypothetical protein
MSAMKPHPHSIARATVDRAVSRCGRDKSERIDLGLSLLHAVRVPGISYTRDEIAAWAGSTDSLIFQIEARAKQKLFRRMAFSADPFLREVALQYFGGDTSKFSAVCSSDRAPARPRLSPTDSVKTG